MKKDDYIARLQKQIEDWERSLESLRSRADLGQLLEDWKDRKDAAMKKLDELKADGSERFDVLRMGVESAWDELRVAFETAMSKSKRPAA
jgi:hypothetical protein